MTDLQLGKVLYDVFHNAIVKLRCRLDARRAATNLCHHLCVSCRASRAPVHGWELKHSHVAALDSTELRKRPLH